jgi:hypothetical protein
LDTGPQALKGNRMQGRFLRQVINKFMTNSEVANNARVQVYMPNGETFDVCGIQLMQNKIIGERESHRLIITVEPTQWHMGKMKKRIGKKIMNCYKTDVFKQSIYSFKLNLNLEEINNFCLDFEKNNKGRVVSNFGGFQSNNLDFNIPIVNKLGNLILGNVNYVSKKYFKVNKLAASNALTLFGSRLVSSAE